MSTHEVPYIDRDPKTGHFQPGHSVSRREQKHIAQRMMELKTQYMAAVSPEDAAVVYREHLSLVTQAADPKLKLAAIALWYDRMFGKPVESINLNTEDTRPAAPVLNVTADQVKVLESIMSANPPSRGS